MKDFSNSEHSDQLQTQRKKRSQRQRAALTAMSVLVVLTVVFTIWALVYIMARGDETTRLAFIMKNRVEETVKCGAVSINQYGNLLAPAEGILVPLVEEGTRVAKGDRIAMIVRPGCEEGVAEFLSANEAYYRKKIIAAGLGNTTEGEIPHTHSVSLMREAIVALSRVPTVGDLSAMHSAIQQMNRALHEYRGESIDADHDIELTELYRERNRLLDQLEGCVVPGGFLTAPAPGTVSFYVSLFDDTKDEKEWRGIADPQAEIERLAALSLQVTDHRQCPVEVNMPVASISNVSADRMVVVIPHNPYVTDKLINKDEHGKFLFYSPVDIIFSSDIRLNRCRIIRIQQSEDYDRIFLNLPGTFELPTCMTAVSDVDMVFSVTTDLAVPVRSLIDLSPDFKVAKLKKVTKGVTKTVSVNLLACDGTYAIIEPAAGEEPLKEADLYVVNPSTIGEGELID